MAWRDAHGTLPVDWWEGAAVRELCSQGGHLLAGPDGSAGPSADRDAADSLGSAPASRRKSAPSRPNSLPWSGRGGQGKRRGAGEGKERDSKPRQGRGTDGAPPPPNDRMALLALARHPSDLRSVSDPPQVGPKLIANWPQIDLKRAPDRPQTTSRRPRFAPKSPSHRPRSDPSRLQIDHIDPKSTHVDPRPAPDAPQSTPSGDYATHCSMSVPD